jgi:phosphoglycolate phosphatase
VSLPTRALRAVLFDLDGTLLDTAADIAAALNGALAEAGLDTVPVARVRTFIGRGVPTLIERALAHLGAAGSDCAPLLERFHAHYARIEARGELTAVIYPGVSAGLVALHERGLRLAVVTNKPTRAATDLLERRGLARCIQAVVGGDSGLPRKPHPQPLLRACGELGVAPAAAFMVGDSLVDVQAARAAGLPVVCVPYGYNEGNDPRTLPCDAFIESLAELPALIAAAAG